MVVVNASDILGLAMLVIAGLFSLWLVFGAGR
jgi:hypothetical protein